MILFSRDLLNRNSPFSSIGTLSQLDQNFVLSIESLSSLVDAEVSIDSKQRLQYLSYVVNKFDSIQPALVVYNITNKNLVLIKFPSQRIADILYYDFLEAPVGNKTRIIV